MYESWPFKLILQGDRFLEPLKVLFFGPHGVTNVMMLGNFLHHKSYCLAIVTLDNRRFVESK